MNRLQDIPRFGLVYAASQTTEGKILKEEYREDFFQALNQYAVQYAELSDNDLCKAVRSALRAMLRSYETSPRKKKRDS